MFGLQIKKGDDWLWVHSASGKLYKYETEALASSALCICYPDQMLAQRLGGDITVRVKEISNELA